MLKLSKKDLATFQSKMGAVDSSYQSSFNLREVVGESFELIQKARKYKVSWEQIAKLLQESSETDLAVSPESIRQYYFEFSKNPELLPKKKRKSKSIRGKQKDKKVSNVPPALASKTSVETSDISVVSGDNNPQDLSDHGITSEQVANVIDSAQEPDEVQAKSESFYKSKDDVRGQFNLGRRRA